MSERYPHYGQWIALMAQRDQGILLVLTVAAVVLGCLYYLRARPRALGIMSVFLSLVYGLVLAISLAGALIGVRP